MSSQILTGVPVGPPLADGTYQIVSLKPASGYWVSQRGGIEVRKGAPSADHDLALGAIVRRVREAQTYISHPVYVGIWTDDDTIYYDASYHVADLERALNLGYANGQLSIWDISADAPISVVTRRF